MNLRSFQLLAPWILMGSMATVISCSTIAEPAEEGPPICDCDPGERKLHCRTGEFWVKNEMYNGTPTGTEYTTFCIDEDATQEEKDQACIDACYEWLVDPQGLFYCDFLPVSDPVRWTACVAPEVGTTGTGDGAGAGAELECPGWYAPHAVVMGYEPLTPGSAEVHIESAFLEQLIADPLMLYVCDSARYKELATGEWTFVDVEPSNLLYNLGLRTGDGIVTVQGFDPLTYEPTTAAHRLDSVDEMLTAYTKLEHAAGVRLMVERDVDFEIWITIDR